MSRGHILIVDDEESIRLSLQDILQDEGFTITQAADGDQALQILQEESPDVVLLDVWLPGLNGIQALQAVRKERANLEVIMMSGHANIETAVKATKLGAFDFIEKPFTLEQVIRTVELALRQQSLIRENEEFRGRLEQATELVGRSQALLGLRHAIEAAALRNGPVLIHGERGTGKELVARLIQDRRAGLGYPYARVNSREDGDGPLSLLRRIFGYQNSSGKTEIGQLEKLNDGVLYLSAVERMPPKAASRLAAALKSGKFQRENGRRSNQLKTTIILATTVDLQKVPIQEVLGEELAECIEEDPVRVPPLRERWEDIRSLVEHFLSQFCSNRGVRRPIFDEAAMKALESHHWPGNIKALKGLVEQLVLEGTGDVIGLSALPKEIRGETERLPQIDHQHTQNGAWEKNQLAELYAEHHGNLRKIAALLDLSEGQLRTKLEEYGIAGKKRPARTGVIQRTLGKSVLLSGQGLHSGLKTGLILSPLPPNSGIVFGNLTSEHTVNAYLDHVVSTDSATTLQKGAMTVWTIEHLMSALHAYGISNALIKVAEEIPIMDGSAKEFCRLIEEAGIVEQDAHLEPLEIASALEVVTKRRRRRRPVPLLRIEPHAQFVIDCEIVLPKPIGIQRYVFTLERPESYRDEIAPARTFGRIKDVESQGKRGLVGGGRLDNVILLDEGKVINTELRYPDEFVRHKILDIIGDLYLLGRPLKGKVIARMSGHTENIALLRKLHAQ